MEDDPDGRGPPGGEAGRGRGALGRAGPGDGERAGARNTGPREGVKEKPFSFSETKQTLSI